MQNDRQITITTAGNRKSKDWKPQQLWWSGFIARCATPVCSPETLAAYMGMTKSQQNDLKDVGGYLGGTLKGTRRKAQDVTGRDLVTLDLDNIPVGGTEAVLKQLEALGCGYTVYSTRKHSPAGPRLRVVFPLDRTATADEYEPLARKTAEYVGIGWCDPTTFQAVRMMFWPSRCVDGEYVYHHADKPFLAVEGMLALYTDWRDTSSWPQVPGEQARQQLKAERQTDPRTKGGVVGAFCRTYDIYQALDAFLPGMYELADSAEDRYTYAGGTTAGGAVVYDNGLYLYSHHATDPCSVQLVNAFDLVRLHLYGALDDDVDETTPVNRRPSYLKMEQMALADPQVETLAYAERMESVRSDFAVPSAEASRISCKPLDFTDAGNAHSFARIFHGQAIYVKAIGWLCWDGKRWADNDLDARKLAIALTDRMLAEATNEVKTAGEALAAAKVADDQEAEQKAKIAMVSAEAFRKHAKASRSAQRIAGMLTLAMPLMQIPLDRLDADPYLLNTPDGVVDLRTGGIAPHDPQLLCTKITRFGPGGEGADLWEDVIATVTESDAELAAFHKRVAGMAAIGCVFEESLIIALGDGKNGKSVEFNTLAHVLGDYAGTIAAEILTTAGKSKGAELATLKGKRLIIAAETEEGARLSPSMVKQITSTDKIHGERKYRDPEDFAPSHSVVLYTNHLPRVGSTDTGIWRRLVVIPFKAKIDSRKEVKGYTNILIQKAGHAIIKWIIEGAQDFIAASHSLTLPVAVADAVEKYRKENDWMAAFMAECCDIGQGKTAQSGLLYDAYRAWTERTGEYKRHARDFNAELEKLGYLKHTNKKGATWYGIALAGSTFYQAISGFPPQ